jgi:ElaB/YqjD/DUF883 family membrane-anchored ribosome-binding protein
MPRTNEQHSATDDLKDTAAEIGQNVRDMGGQAVDAAREQFKHVKDQAAGYYKKGRKRALDMEDEFEDYIREQPLKSLLIAAGVGMLVGMFWRRR